MRQSVWGFAQGGVLTVCCPNVLCCNTSMSVARGIARAAAHVKCIEDVPEVLDCRPAAIGVCKPHAVSVATGGSSL